MVVDMLGAVDGRIDRTAAFIDLKLVNYVNGDGLTEELCPSE